MLFNKRISIRCIRVQGTKRVMTGRYQWEGETAYEFGLNIIPKRIGFLVWIWITDVQKVLEKELKKRDEHITTLKEIVRMVMSK